MEEKILGFITSLFGKKQYVCPFCHEHYTFSAMHARKLADKDGKFIVTTVVRSYNNCISINDNSLFYNKNFQNKKPLS